MATTSVINIDIAAQTATNVFTLNNVVLNTVSLANNQITFNTRVANSLSINDLSLNIAQLLTFQVALEINFPILGNLYNTTMGTCAFNIARNDGTTCTYTHSKIDDWSYDFTTGLCTIKARNIPTTLNYSTWLYSLIMVQKFLKEIKV